MQNLSIVLILILVQSKYIAVDGCTTEEFKCSDGTCINAELRCDDEFNCPDQSDEKNCTAHQPCPENLYKCPNGECVSNKETCSTESSMSNVLSSWSLFTSNERLSEYTATFALSLSDIFSMTTYLDITTAVLKPNTILQMPSSSDIRSQTQVTVASNNISSTLSVYSIERTTYSKVLEPTRVTPTLLSTLNKSQPIYSYATEEFISSTSLEILSQSHSSTDTLSYLDVSLSDIDKVSSARISLFDIQTSHLVTGFSDISKSSTLNTLMNSLLTESIYSSSQGTSVYLNPSQRVSGSYERSSDRISNDSSNVSSIKTNILESETILRMQTTTPALPSHVSSMKISTQILSQPSSTLSNLVLLEDSVYLSHLSKTSSEMSYSIKILSTSKNTCLSSSTLYSSPEATYGNPKRSSSLTYMSYWSEITQPIYMSDMSSSTTPINYITHNDLIQTDSLFLLVIIPFTIGFLIILIGFLVLLHRMISRRNGLGKKKCDKESIELNGMDSDTRILYRKGHVINTSSYKSTDIQWS